MIYFCSFPFFLGGCDGFLGGGVYLEKLDFELKMVHIHPFWLRICLPPAFNYPGLDFHGLEAQKWPQSTKNDNFSKIKKLTIQKLLICFKSKNN